LSNAPDLHAALGQLLVRARQGLRADAGVVLLFSATGEADVCELDGEHLRPLTIEPTVVDELLRAASGTGAASCPDASPALDALGVRTLIVAELRTERGLAGLLAVGQTGRVNGYQQADVKLLHSLATHAAIVLRLGTVGSAYATLQSEQAELEYKASHDPLTGLANRRALLARLDGIAHASGRCGIVYLDLDGFKPVNDRWGHHAGDLVLIEVAARLRATVRPGDLVVRLGGDEFAVVIDDPKGAAEVEGLVRCIGDNLGPMDLDGIPEPVVVSASIGTALGDLRDESPFELLERADASMYQAKAARSQPPRGPNGTAHAWS
jgi:diguanylate cyclase (GGDEF)-like protein